MSNGHDYWKSAFEYKHVRSEDRPLHQQWRDRIQTKLKKGIQRSVNISTSFFGSRLSKRVSRTYLVCAALLHFCKNFFWDDLKTKKNAPHKLDRVLNLPDRDKRNEFRRLLKYPLMLTVCAGVGTPIYLFHYYGFWRSPAKKEFERFERVRSEYSKRARTFRPSSPFDEYSTE